MTQFTKQFHALWRALACSVALLLAGQAQAALVISIGTAGCSTNMAINDAIGQSFRVNATTNLGSIAVWIQPGLYRTTSYGLQLFDGEGTSGTLLATSPTTVTLGSLSEGTPSGFQAFSFMDQSITLQPNHAYTFRLVRLSEYTGGFSQCANVYAGGIQYWQGSSPDSYYDTSFKLYDGVPQDLGLQLNSASTSYVDAGNLSIPADFTLEAWARPASTGALQALIAKEAGCVGQNQFRLMLDSSNQVVFLMTDGSGAHGGLWNLSYGYVLRSSSALPLNAWTHVAVTKNGNVFKLYLNGTEEAMHTASVNLMHSGTRPFRVGARVGCGAVPADFAFNGQLDEVRVWSVGRSGADIAAYMNSPVFPWELAWSDLKAYWRLDESSGTVARDSKGTYPGTLVNGPVWFAQ